MSRSTNIVKYNNKEKYVYSGYEIAFDGKRKWRFGNDFARNVINLGLIIVHHLILTILKIIFLFLGELFCLKRVVDT